MANPPSHTPFPVRGVPGGWRGPWDGPDETAELRASAEAIERRLAITVQRVGLELRAEIREERRQASGRTINAGDVSPSPERGKGQRAPPITFVDKDGGPS